MATNQMLQSLDERVQSLNQELSQLQVTQLPLDLDENS